MSETNDDRMVWRARIVAVCLGLTALAFAQRPGRIVPDTKLDLTVAPWGFLRDALHLWDVQGFFGQLQNQAYGYLLPMGPFHGLLLSAGVPAWVVQRLWWSALLIVAFLGAFRLARELDLGSRGLCLLGALAYALSPRILSELTTSSVEIWPMALAPWVLLPLVDRRERSWAWRISRSALAVALCGGVNAVATGAVLVLPALWFLTRRPTRTVVLAGVSWLAAVLLAIAWWLIPLALLGRFSPPFLDWIEGSAITTKTASPFEALRGTSAWLGYLALPNGASWPAGWAFVTIPQLIIASALVAALGLVGLTRRRVRERTFLLVSVLVGMILLTLGHLGPLAPPWAGALQDLLDGPLAALRNTHKFDLVVRLPLALGLIVALEVLVGLARRFSIQRWAQVVAVGALGVALTSPALTGGLARSDDYLAVPTYWRQAAAWLDRQPGPGTVLVVPGSSFSDFVWGSTKDNPLQALMRRPFAVRDAVPLGSAGSTRLLDGLQGSIGSGEGGPQVARALAAAGVGFVVLPSDLRPDAAVDPPLVVESALRRSGLTPAADFGPVMAQLGESAGETTDYRTRQARPAIQVYAVPQVREAALLDRDALATALAGPEDLPALSEAGHDYALLGGDAGALDQSWSPAAADILTDGLRRTELNFGASAYNRSAVLTADEPYRQDRRAHDYVADPRAPHTVATWRGIAGVRVSSSASDAAASLRIGSWASPAAALDGDIGTRWVSGRFGQAEGEWFELRLDSKRSVGGIRVLASGASPVGAMPRTLLLSTAAGSRDLFLDENGFGIGSLPPGETDWIRLTMTERGPGSANGFALAEVAVPGLAPEHILAAPAANAPAQILLRRADSFRSGCLVEQDQTACAPTLTVPTDTETGLRRRVTLSAAGSYAMTGQVRATGQVDSLLTNPTGITAQSSSRLLDRSLNRGGAAVDGDLGTGWVASVLDFAPRLTLHLPESRSIRGLQFIKNSTLAASTPLEVTLRFGSGEPITARVDEQGYVRFPARATGLVRVFFGATQPLVNTDSTTGARTFVPVGVSEIRILGAEDLIRPIDPAAATGAPCGFGPDLQVGDRTFPTKVVGTLADILAQQPLQWSVCGSDPVALPAGASDIVALPSGQFEPVSLTLGSTPAAGAAYQALTLERSSASGLRLQLPARAGATVVAVAQNYNAGWRASLTDGTELDPVRVNGWMQGWQVPPGGASAISAIFAPDRGYRAALVVGGMCLMVLAAAVVRTRHRPQARAAASALERAGMPAPPQTSWAWRPLPSWARRPVPALAAGGAGLLVSGPVGALIGIGIVIAALRLGPRSRPVLSVAIPVLVILAALLAALQESVGSATLSSGWVQAAVVAALVSAILLVSSPEQGDADEPASGAATADPNAGSGAPSHRN